MGQKQTLIEELKPLMKENGYKKRGQTWHKENEDLIIVFNIQNSYYDKEEYYINLGIIIKALTSEGESACITNCHMSTRVDKKNEKGLLIPAATLVRILKLWEEWYGDIRSLRIKAIEGNLPIFCTAEAKTFLTTVRLG